MLTQAEIGDYWQEQDFQVSARLHLQNWIWNYQLGYVLHPHITLPKDSHIKVADIACGNGAWMLDLYRERPNVTFHGFDVTASGFPAEDWRPENFHYHVWNAFDSVPEEFAGVFDVVHVRTIYTAVVGNKVEPLVENLLKMLKPGGYIQWDEGDPTTLTAQKPSDSKISNEATSTIIQNFIKGAQTHSNLQPEWVHNLPKTLTAGGCEMLANDSVPLKKELQRAWCDNFLTVFMGIIPLIPEEANGRGMSRKEFVDLFKKAVDECRKGVWINVQQWVFVARKSA